MYIEELKNIKSGPREIRNFGLLIGVVLLVIACTAFLLKGVFHQWLVLLGGALVVLGLFFPRALLPLQKLWMGLAIVIGYVASKIVLIVVFYAVLTPIALTARLFGKHFLKLNFADGSYWNIRTLKAVEKKSMEKQF